ncbi:MAG TPA: nuclear transport factor 2 family protein [Rhodanobacteraceae bacterium]|nr:nuclear transport factor 2 family protein [Rhodanobacteraceae bacterium]
MTDTTAAQARHVYHEWDRCARERDTEGLLDLYTPDAVLESPLIPVILDVPGGVLQGQAALRHFFEEGGRRRPNPLVRWYREPDRYGFDGSRLTWEYPRAAPDGDQIGLVEVMDLDAGRIRHHRIYWDWFGFGRLLESARKKWAPRS